MRNIQNNQEVDVYIANIIDKFGSFKYAEIKTPFNPQTVDEHLLDMIPTLKGPYHNRHKAKSDLTLRIIKTGDNHLSVVKKGQSAKESLSVARTIDITGDGTISRTPTPPKPPAPRRQTIDIRSKRFKTANRIGGGAGGDLNVSDSAAFDMQRRQSVAVENMRPKKVAATVAFKRRSIELSADAKNLSAPAKTIAREIATPPQPLQPPQPPQAARPSITGKPADGSRPAAKQPIEISRPVGRPPISQAARKRKALAHPTKPTESPATPAKVKRADEKLHDEVCENEANILRSVGLVKKVVADGGETATASTRCSVSISRIDAKARSPSDDKEHSAKGKKSHNQRSSFLHRPIIEIKEEPTSDNDGDVVVVQPLKHSTPLSDGQRRAAKAERQYSAAASAKAAAAAASSDDDDSLMIIEDDWPAKPTAAARSSAAKSSEVRRGAISVRDLSKMKSTEAAEKAADGGATARRTLPKNATNTSGGAGSSILKPVNANANANKPTPATNNTRAPQDLQGRDASYSATQPPPLSVVGKSNAVSLLVKNQPPKESPSTANGPPPLSLNQSTSSGATPSSSAPSTPPATTPNTLANGMLTEELASAVADTLLGNLPSLTARPSRPGASQPHSSDAGPVSRTLMENAYKMTDFFRSVIEDTLADLSAAPNLEAKVRMLELELERERSARAKETAELKANTDRLLAEMKKSMDKERARCVQDTRKKCELERIKSVEDTKKKLWCAQCSKEALFYCCWNTSYCEHACQKKHW